MSFEPEGDAWQGWDRRSFLGAMAALSVFAPGTADASMFYRTIRGISRDMAKQYKLEDDKKLFNELFGVQNAFRGLKSFPGREQVIQQAMSNLRRILNYELIPKTGFEKVRRSSHPNIVVFSDHHILPSDHRQGAVWRANVEPYVRLLKHYAEQDYLVVENGDVEDLVIMEPSDTVRAYKDVYDKSSYKRHNPRTLLQWFRKDPWELQTVLRQARSKYRQKQLHKIYQDPQNKAYYEFLRELGKADRLVRLTGNHDYELQDFDGVEDHLVPDDIFLNGQERPTIFMHGHQFDAATNPSVAPFYGEVVSECLGVFFQGPDRYWSPREGERMVRTGFPNRLSAHHQNGNAASHFASAILADGSKDDEEWARAWESLFGHPIAWEYGAANWMSSVKYGFARPGNVIDNAMSGRQFFKYRHLDEWDIVRSMQEWGFDNRLVLGHSHEIRDWQFAPDGPAYSNSGAAGRFARLIWALEFNWDKVTVVGWYAGDHLRRYRFEVRETDMNTYFHSHPTRVTA